MIRMLIGFMVFMLLFIGGAIIGGDIAAILGFIAGIGAWFAIATGYLDFKVRPLRD